MGYYLRYISTDVDPLDLAVLMQGLREIDAGLEIRRSSDREMGQDGELYCGDELYAQIEVSLPGDGLFDEELDELRERSESIEPEQDRERVGEVLGNARAIVAVRVLWGGRASEATLERFDVLWDFLFDNWSGLLQDDGGGYHDRSGRFIEETD